MCKWALTGVGHALRKHGNNVLGAARELGVTRGVLRGFMKRRKIE